MILLRTLAIWVGCGVASILTLRTHAEDETGPAPEQPTRRADPSSVSDQRETDPAGQAGLRRVDRVVTLQFVEPQLEATSLSLKGPEL
jgi:hypothetical protein